MDHSSAETGSSAVSDSLCRKFRKVDMPYRYAALFLLLTVAVAGDIRNYKIPNAVILCGIAAGVIVNAITGGLGQIADSLLATAIPALLLLVLFALRMLGAGDIKLFCAAGAIMGVRFILYAMAFSFLAGGILALVVMIVRGNIKQRLRYIFTWLKTCFLTGKLSDYTDFGDKSDGAKFHFSYAIAAGCLIETAAVLFF